MDSKASVFSLLGVAALSVLTACGSLVGEADPSAKAKLDYENNLIIKPLDEFGVSEKDSRTMDLAQVRVVESCMRQKGVDVVPFEGEFFRSGSRDFGLWNEKAARQEYKMFLPSFGQAPEGSYFERAHAELKGTCEKENSSLLKSMSVNPEPGIEYGSLAGGLASEASDKARKTPEWDAAIEPWMKCLKNKGLTPEPGRWGTKEEADLWGKKLEDPKGVEEFTRVALIEARCAQDTGMVQKLADLEASYEMPLLRKNEAELKAEKEKIQKALASAEEYLAQH